MRQDPVGTVLVATLAVTALALVCSALALGFALAIAIVRRRPVVDDPYGAPFGDVPHLFGSGAGVALPPEAGGGGPSRVLSGDAAARAFYRSQALADE